ncbi:MAG: hypothetical protein ACRCTL_02315 [Pseudomonas sp.]
MLKWKIFFWLSSFCLSVAAISIMLTPMDIGALDLISLLAQIFAQFFIYGYAYQKEIGTKTISAVVFCLNLFLCLYVITISTIELIAEASLVSFAILAPGIGLSLIVLIPLYLYTYKSEHIWQPVV